MLGYILKRLMQMIPTLLGVIALVFVLFRYFGGDPAEILAGLNASPEQVDSIRTQLGLNDPPWVQLGIFLRSLVTFDWGNSWATQESVASILTSRLPATLTVMVPILIFDAVLALPIAMWVAMRRGSLTDRMMMAICTVALSISFLVYILIGQYVFGFLLGWFPVQGWSDSLLTNLTVYTPLPVLLAIIIGIAPQTRLYRSFFLDEIHHDYVRTANAKGLTPWQIMFKHVLPNTLIPIATNIGMALPGVFIGSFLLETFFSIPGLGRELLLAVNRSDYPVIQAMTVYLAILTMLFNLMTDVVYAILDPRVKLK
jgi:peptide/nickel transport system permease protein